MKNRYYHKEVSNKGKIGREFFSYTTHVKRGDVFGNLTVMYEVYPYYDKSGRKVRQIKCKCICGKTKEIPIKSLRQGVSKSCGCSAYKDKITHGMTKTKVYKTWISMKKRCTEKNRDDFPSYIGRGITYCKRWKKFENFYEDMGNPPSKKHSIDRINNNKGYFPKNCRWATAREQANNRRDNHLLKYNGESRTIAEWARYKKIAPDTLWKRINLYGWIISDALEKEVRKRSS